MKNNSPREELCAEYNFKLEVNHATLDYRQIYELNYKVNMLC